MSVGWVAARRFAPTSPSPFGDLPSIYSASVESDGAVSPDRDMPLHGSIPVGINNTDQPDLPRAPPAVAEPPVRDGSPAADSESSDLDSYYDSSDYDLPYDHEQVHPTTIPLGLTRDYAPSWNKADAFREFFQNWKDALVTSFDLDPRSFVPERRETKNEILFTMHKQTSVPGHPPTKELLGYIRYKRREGSLELTNFDARLEMRNLSLGGGTKVGNSKSAGVHGEGFKLAALVMLRRNHAVRISSSSHYWNFSLRGTHRDRLCCRLTAPQPHVLRRSKDRAAGDTPRSKLIPRMWQDVTVKISKSRDGYKVYGDEVKEWFKVAIDLAGPQADSIIRADQGDLILDPDFAGQVFLKGLRVSGHGPDGREYVFGYNFAIGYINRDRERLTNKEEEAEMVASLWERAIGDGADDVVQKYITLFHEHEHSPDIALVDRVVSERMARSIWSGLQTNNPDAFFYFEDGASQSNQVAIILSNIKKQPERAPKALWKILRKYSLARTPEEERRRLFMSCERIETTNNVFGASSLRMLRAAMLLDKRLENISIQVVEGGETGLELIYIENEKLILLHSKWLDFGKTHEQAVCDFSELSQEVDIEGFSCDHVVEDLIELVIQEVGPALELDPSGSKKIRQLARKCIRQTPRKVHVSPTLRAGELYVRWVGNESGIVARDHSSKIWYDVILHKASSCRQAADQLLHRQVPDEDGVIDMDCDCDRQAVCLNSCRAVFRGLDGHEEYFPMVARSGVKTFFACPPEALAPRLHEENNVAQERAEAQDDDLQDNAPADLGLDSLQSPGFPQVHSFNAAMDVDNTHENNGAVDEDNTIYVQVQSGNNRASSLSVGGDIDLHSQDGNGPEPQAYRHEWEALQQDNEAWHEWYKTDLPKITAELFYTPPRRSNCTSLNIYEDSSIVCERLGCNFETDSYVRFREDTAYNPEYIALIHEIHSGTDGCATQSPHFTATLWSYIEAEPLFEVKDPDFWADAKARPPSSKELLLHFTSLENMGRQSDSQLICIDNIIEAEVLPQDFEIAYCATPPTDGDTPFCRFARNSDCDTITLVPLTLASRLLQRKDRERPRGFSNPSTAFVVDLTPNVLGPLEGFTNSGCSPWLGLGFNPESDLSWRVRYPSCEVFDGSPSDVLRDFAAGRLLPPEHPPTGHPVIVSSSTVNTNFRLNPANKRLPLEEDLLAPLFAMNDILNSPFEFDFGVLQIAPSLLSPVTIQMLSISVLEALQHKYMVRINLVNLRDYGLLQDRKVLVILTSRFPGLASVPLRPYASRASDSLRSAERVGDKLDELNFKNQRVREGKQAGFVSSLVRGGGDNRNLPLRNIYNHPTGERGIPGSEAHMPLDSVGMDDNNVLLSWDRHQPPYHRDRGDYLTPREIARLLNFDDDFVLYGSLHSQYREILSAQPPALSKAIAENILEVAELSRRVEIPVVHTNSRPSKRARVDDDDE